MLPISKTHDNPNHFLMFLIWVGCNCKSCMGAQNPVEKKFNATPHFNTSASPHSIGTCARQDGRSHACLPTPPADPTTPTKCDHTIFHTKHHQHFFFAISGGLLPPRSDHIYVAILPHPPQSTLLSTSPGHEEEKRKTSKA